MKVKKRYTLFVNGFTGYAFYGNKTFESRIEYATLGQIFYCSLRELISNLKQLEKSGYTIMKMRH